MSEPTPQTPEAPAPAETAPTAQPAPEATPPGQDVDSLPAWARTALDKANKEAARYRTELREAQPLAARARELEEATKSEQQRLTERADALAKDLSNRTVEAARYRLAAEYGIGKDHFDLIGGGTEEEMEDRAARIATLVAARAPQPVTAPPGRGSEQLRPGATPTQHETEDDALYAAIYGPSK